LAIFPRGTEGSNPGSSSGESAANLLDIPALIIERPVSGIEIELMGGRRVRFDRDIDAETMRRVVSALEGGGP
jgi:hypothetical protein